MDTDKENKTELVNKSNNYEDDPLLREFDEMEKQTKGESSEEDGSGSEESSEEELSDIKFPKGNAQELLQFINRDLNNLANKEDKQKRKFSLLKLYEIFVLAKVKANNAIYQELLPEI